MNFSSSNLKECFWGLLKCMLSLWLHGIIEVIPGAPIKLSPQIPHNLLQG